MKKFFLATLMTGFIGATSAHAIVPMEMEPTEGSIERLNAIPEAAPKKFVRANDLKNERSAGPVKQVDVDAWRAVEGRSLHTILEEWTRKAGWTLAWNTDQDYILRAGVEFEGEFEGAASSLIKAFQIAKPPVFGQFHRGNKVLVITTPKDVDQR